MEVSELEAIQALTGLKVYLRVIQQKLTISCSFYLILSYLEPHQVIQTQTLSKVFYEKHVPNALSLTPAEKKISEFVSNIGIRKIIKGLCLNKKLEKLYDGPE